MRVYIRVEGKPSSKKCTKRIKFTFEIYAVKAKVVVGCFSAFTLEVLPFTCPHSFLSFSASVTEDLQRISKSIRISKFSVAKV